MQAIGSKPMATTTHTPLYELSIRIFSDGFSFLLQQNGGVKLELCEEVPQSKLFYHKLFQKLAELPMELRNNAHTVVTIHHTSYTLIPTSLYRPQEESLWLGVVKERLSPDVEIQAKELSAYGCVVLFEVPRQLSELAAKGGSAPLFRSVAIELLEGAATASLEKKTAIYLYLERRQMHVVALKEGKLLLSNHFDVGTNTDVLYHLLHVTEVLALSPEKLQLHLAGNTDLLSVKQTLYPYFNII